MVYQHPVVEVVVRIEKVARLAALNGPDSPCEEVDWACLSLPQVSAEVLEWLTSRRYRGASSCCWVVKPLGARPVARQGVRQLVRPVAQQAGTADWIGGLTGLP